MSTVNRQQNVPDPNRVSPTDMIARQLQATFEVALNEAMRRRHEFVTLEHLLFALLRDPEASVVLRHVGADLEVLERELDTFMTTTYQRLADDSPVEPEMTSMFQRVVQYAQLHAKSAGQKEIDSSQMVAALFQAERSHAVFLLKKQGITRLDVLSYISHGISKIDSKPERLIEGETDQPAAAADPLKSFAVNLLERAAKGGIDPLIGRGPELERTIQILCRRKKNNPLFVGEPGVGKTAIAEGLALMIHEGRVPDVLKSSTVYALDMGAVVAGTKYRGEFEQRLKSVLTALAKVKDSILFIDEIHTIVGAGAVSGGSMDASNIIKPALAEGQLRCIGSTTYAEYKASFERDRALARRFQKIEVGEPTVGETIEILRGLKQYYENFHGVTFSDEALRLAAELSAKYIHERHLPDKAIDVLDEAGARARMQRSAAEPQGTVLIIGEAEVEMVVARMAKIPPRSIASNERELLRGLEENLKIVIFGQDQAIRQVVSAIKLSRSGLGNVERPIGSFLFSGPTGVGKTELSRQLALALGVEFIRFDMSEYMEPHTVSRLIGAPPGYVGFDQGGLLTDAINKTPYAVLVLDEIEKAHPNLFSILLQVMDHATLTDNNGKKADFRNVVLIMTTNAGAREMSDLSVGFNRSGITGKGRGAIEKAFAPEFRNRLDAWIAFEPLSMSSIELVVDKFVGELVGQLAARNVRLELTPSGRAWLAGHGYDRSFGARPMARLIQARIKEPLVDAVLFGDLQKGGQVVVIDRDGDLALDVTPTK